MWIMTDDKNLIINGDNVKSFYCELDGRTVTIYADEDIIGTYRDDRGMKVWKDLYFNLIHKNPLSSLFQMPPEWPDEEEENAATS